MKLTTAVIVLYHSVLPTKLRPTLLEKTTRSYDKPLCHTLYGSDVLIVFLRSPQMWQMNLAIRHIFA